MSRASLCAACTRDHNKIPEVAWAPPERGGGEEEEEVQSPIADRGELPTGACVNHRGIVN